MVLLETCWLTCFYLVYCSIPVLLIDISPYSKTCFVDIRSIFGEVDHLSRSDKCNRSRSKNSDLYRKKNLELKMLRSFQEAIALHRNVNRYRLYLEILIIFHLEHLYFSIMCSLAEVMDFIILEMVLLFTLIVFISVLMIGKVTTNNVLCKTHKLSD